jgi:4-aminobutyrate aminotransferase-like enzyme
MTMSKALGNGIPIAAFSAAPKIAAKFIMPSASTLGGNPVSATAALAVLDYIEQEGLCERAERLGAILKARLLEIQRQCPLISEVRGKGLMLGAELSSNGHPLPRTTNRVLETLKNRGIIVGKNGLHRNVIAFQPPLVIDEADIGFLTDNLAEVLQACSGRE